MENSTTTSTTPSSHTHVESDPLQAINSFNKLLIQHRGFTKFDFPSALEACSKAFALSPGKQIHALSIKCCLSTGIYTQTYEVDLKPKYFSFLTKHMYLAIVTTLLEELLVAYEAVYQTCDIPFAFQMLIQYAYTNHLQTEMHY